MARSSIKLQHTRNVLGLKTDITKLRIRRASDQDQIQKKRAELDALTGKTKPKG